jgi:hypothetical protein
MFLGRGLGLEGSGRGLRFMSSHLFLILIGLLSVIWLYIPSPPLPPPLFLYMHW